MIESRPFDRQLEITGCLSHLDDESMGIDGTLAKYSAEGVGTYYICASRGERGWFGSNEDNPGMERLGQLHAQELENAVNELAMQGTF